MSANGTFDFGVGEPLTPRFLQEKQFVYTRELY